MNHLNQKILDKSYKDVEMSLSGARGYGKGVLLKSHINDDLEDDEVVLKKNPRNILTGGIIDEKPIVLKVYPLTGTLYAEPLERGLSEYVLTRRFVVHPLSFGFAYIQKPFKELNPPIHMSRERIVKQPPSRKEDIFKDFQKQSNGELKLINKAVLDSQSGIFGEVVKRALASFFSGQGLVGMSMPVRIFEPRSTLQRIADNMCYITVTLRKANDEKDAVERAKLCMAGMASGICMSPGQMKPFNPYLGETYEATYSDGSELYMEHTSHHPPISNFLIKTVYGATVSGRFEHVPDMSTNEMELIYRGPFNIQFSDGSRSTMFYPTGVQSGIVFGSRMLKFAKKICYIDENNHIKGYLELGKTPESGKFKHKRVDIFSGEIYEYDPSKHKGYGENYKSVYDAFKGKDKIATLSSGQGSIFESLEFDQVEYWNFDTAVIERATPVENPLPSDYRFREDLVWLEYGDKDQAQKWKLKLEEIQRWDRGLRQEAEKKRKKNK